MTSPEQNPERRADDSTVGSGSAIGLGCVMAVLALVILALAARWLLGAW